MQWFITYTDIKLLNAGINIGQFIFYMIYITFMLIVIWDCKKISKETNEKIQGYFL